jgi:hypothetical protein
VREVVPDSLLLQLLVAWLSPGAAGGPEPGAPLALSARVVDIENVRAWQPGVATTMRNSSQLDA